MAADKALLKELGICVIIPTYNNAGTIEQVIHSVSEYCNDIFVVCDGPTDGTEELVRQCATPVHVIAYQPNKGKGTALVTGFREALKLGFRYAITIDSDGQHYASDIPAFVEATHHRQSRTQARQHAPKEHLRQQVFQLLVHGANGQETA